MSNSTEGTSSATAAWLQRDETAIAGVLSRVFDIVAESGEGCWLTDVDGRRYLDMTSGIAVTSVGHCNPVVVEAVQQQAAKLLHTSVVTHHQPAVLLAERLRSLVPYIDRAQVFFCNSGAEAVDGALKLTRVVTKKPGVIAFRRAFHGRTLGATSITTAKGKYRNGYEPLLPSVHIAPYCVDDDWSGALAALDEILALQAPAGNVGAMIVEPVLGEGGYVPAPEAWLHGLRERCNSHGMLLVFDEVQCGIGRTGAMFAAETYEVSPDVILFAKGIANGLPLGGIIASQAVMDNWPRAAHGSTFGGNPISCAAALATLDVIESQHLCERARLLGERIVSVLDGAELSAASVEPGARGARSRAVDVRGLGLMVGIELRDAVAAAEVQARCLEQDVLVLTCGPDDNVVRLAPPLTITDEEVDSALRVLQAALLD